MVRATYWKINTVYVAFIILYFITIEEVCCVSDCEESKKFTGSQKYDSFRNISNCEESRKFNGLQKSASSRNTSFVKRLGKSFKGLTSGNSDVENVNEICLSDIKNDLKNCKDAKSCAEKMFYTVKDFEGLQLYTKTYVLYLYREIAIKYKDYLITPNEYCKIVFEDDSDRNKIKDEIEMYKKCIHKNKAYGFWHKYAHRTVVQAFFLSKNEQDGVKLDENFLDIVKSVKTRFITDTEVMNWKGKRGPTEFCSAKCIDQISYAFNDCKSFKECAIFAYRYLIKKELKFFALQYMKYLYENIEIGKYSIKYDLNDLTKKGKISTIEESIVMTPKSFCIVIADELWSTIVIDIVQWSTRAKGKIFN
ncbi:Hypothetical protein CINCED_3A020286 [Cinara cedri]|uniref:Uncharacterized protein n=1 Tax=Cinara cedri TaxID=506608 RepID=A0A5E4NEP3_9HEMI|nr:Hypothetical protein CINCED_3A020286 [Cinara cedri]